VRSVGRYQIRVRTPAKAAYQVLRRLLARSSARGASFLWRRTGRAGRPWNLASAAPSREYWSWCSVPMPVDCNLSPWPVDCTWCEWLRHLPALRASVRPTQLHCKPRTIRQSQGPTAGRSEQESVWLVGACSAGRAPTVRSANPPRSPNRLCRNGPSLPVLRRISEGPGTWLTLQARQPASGKASTPRRTAARFVPAGIVSGVATHTAAASP
jgi:hypothetical protein